MRSKLIIGLLFLIGSACLPGSDSYAQVQSKRMLVGAYYFDGWTGKTFHITKSLEQNYSVREPVWGWITSTPEIIQKQVDLAVEAKIDFFSFCWYYSDLYKKNLPEPRNHALNVFLDSTAKKGLKFNLLVANHTGYSIGPADWERLTKVWIDLFKKDAYLKFKGKPLITFLSLNMLLQSFGTIENVKGALAQFRAEAVASGLKGVNIAICIPPLESEAAKADACGFDFLTGYNYHDQTLISGQSVSPIKAISPKEESVWNAFLKFGKPYLPVTTLNWDPRPWDEMNKAKRTSPHFEGYSRASVYKSIKELKAWTLKNNPSGSTANIAMIYAWNEYGEGAWLTPTEQNKNGLLEAVKEALQ